MQMRQGRIPKNASECLEDGGDCDTCCQGNLESTVQISDRFQTIETHILDCTVKA
jgi:hypothetical protein